MKNILLIFLFIALTSCLKAQTLTIPNLGSKPLDNTYFKLKPDSSLLKYMPNKLNGNNLAAVKMDPLVINSFSSKMPVVKLYSDDRMPVAKLNSGDRMPVLKLNNGPQTALSNDVVRVETTP